MYRNPLLPHIGTPNAGIRVSVPILVSFPRPLFQHARPLPDGQPDPRPVTDRRCEYGRRLIQIAARIQHAIDFVAVVRPLLELLKIASVGEQLVVGFFVRQVICRHRKRSWQRPKAARPCGSRNNAPN
jgi:hypothetical protein